MAREEEVAAGYIGLRLEDTATPELTRVRERWLAEMARLDKMKAAPTITADTADLDRKIIEAKASVRKLQETRTTVTLDADKRKLTAAIASARAEVARLNDERAVIKIDARQAITAQKEVERLAAIEAKRAALTSRYAREAKRIRDDEDRDLKAAERSAMRMTEIRTRAGLEEAKQAEQVARLKLEYSRLTDVVEKANRAISNSRGEKREQYRLEAAAPIASMLRIKEELNLLGHTPPVKIKVDNDYSGLGMFEKALQKIKDGAKALPDTILGKLASLGNVRVFGNSLSTLITAAATVAPALVAVTAAATSLVGVLGTGLAGASVVAGGTLAGLAINLLGVKVALGSVTQDYGIAKSATDAYTKATYQYGANSKQAILAQQKMNSVLKSVDPVAATAAKGISRLKGEFEALTAHAMHHNIGGILTGGFHTLDKLMPTLAANTNRTFGILGTRIREWEKGIGSAKGINIIDSLGKSANKFLDPLLKGLGHLGAAFGHIAESAARIFSGPAGHGFEKMAERFDKATQPGAKLDATIKRLGDHAHDLFKFFGSLGHLLITVFNGGANAGDGMLKSLTRTFDKWTAFLHTTKGKNEMAAYFKEAAAISGDILHILVTIIGTVGAWSVALAPVVSVVTSILGFVAKIVGLLLRVPLLGGALTALGATIGLVFAAKKVAPLADAIGLVLKRTLALPAAFRAAAAAEGGIGRLKAFGNTLLGRGTQTAATVAGGAASGAAPAAEIETAFQTGGVSAAGEMEAAFQTGGATAAAEMRLALASGGGLPGTLGKGVTAAEKGAIGQAEKGAIGQAEKAAGGAAEQGILSKLLGKIPGVGKLGGLAAEAPLLGKILAPLGIVLSGAGALGAFGHGAPQRAGVGGLIGAGVGGALGLIGGPGGVMLGAGLGSAAGSAIGAASPAIGKAITASVHFVADKSSDAWKWLSGTRETVLKIGTSFVGTAWNAGKSLAKSLISFGGKVVHVVGTAATSAWHTGIGVAKSLVGFGGKVVHVVGAAATSAWHAAKKLGGDLLGFGGKVVHVVGTAATGAWDTGVKLGGQLLGFAGKVVGMTLNVGMDAVNLAISGVEHLINLAGQAASFVASLPGKAFNFIQGKAEGGDPSTPGRIMVSAAAAGTPRRTQGEIVRRPTLLTGEENMPEYVIATNPTYRQKNVGYLAQAADQFGYQLVTEDGSPITAAYSGAGSPQAAWINRPASQTVGYKPPKTKKGKKGSHGGRGRKPPKPNTSGFAYGRTGGDTSQVATIPVASNTVATNDYIATANSDAVTAFNADAKQINALAKQIDSLKNQRSLTKAGPHGAAARQSIDIRMGRLRRQYSALQARIPALQRTLNETAGIAHDQETDTQMIQRYTNEMNAAATLYNAKGGQENLDKWYTAKNMRETYQYALQKLVETAQAHAPAEFQDSLATQLSQIQSDIATAQVEAAPTYTPVVPTLDSFIASLGLTDTLGNLNAAYALSQVNDVPDNLATTSVNENVQSLSDNLAAAADNKNFYLGVLGAAQAQHQPASVIADAANAFVSARDAWQGISDTITGGAAATVQAGITDSQNFSQARQDLYTGMGSNFSPWSNPAPAQPLAPNSGGFGSLAAGNPGAGATTVNVHNTFPTPPPDPHSFANGLAFELRAAV